MSVSHLKRAAPRRTSRPPRAAVDTHRPAQLLNDAANDVQPQAQPVVLTGADGAFERLEDSPVKLGRDPEPAVGHLQARAPRWLSAAARMTTGRPCPYLTALATRFVTT